MNLKVCDVYNKCKYKDKLCTYCKTLRLEAKHSNQDEQKKIHRK